MHSHIFVHAYKQTNKKMHIRHKDDLLSVSHSPSLEKAKDFMHQCDLMASPFSTVGLGEISAPRWPPLEALNIQLQPCDVALPSISCKTFGVCKSVGVAVHPLGFSWSHRAIHTGISHPLLGAVQPKGGKPKEKLPKIYYAHHIRLSKFTLDMITNVKYYSELCVDFSALRLCS